MPGEGSRAEGGGGCEFAGDLSGWGDVLGEREGGIRQEGVQEGAGFVLVWSFHQSRLLWFEWTKRGTEGEAKAKGGNTVQ